MCESPKIEIRTRAFGSPRSAAASAADSGSSAPLGMSRKPCIVASGSTGLAASGTVGIATPLPSLLPLPPACGIVPAPDFARSPSQPLEQPSSAVASANAAKTALATVSPNPATSVSNTASANLFAPLRDRCWKSLPT